MEPRGLFYVLSFIIFSFFFRFDFSLRHEQHANGAFFISWNVFVELLYAHISHISNTTSRIPYSARARRYLLPLRRYLEILLPNFCFGFSPYRPNLSYRFVYICIFFLTSPLSPSFGPASSCRRKGIAGFERFEGDRAANHQRPALISTS